APVLTPATPSLPTINEDDINNSGILISTLLGASVSDIDSGSLLGIAVTDLSSGNGTWEYSTDGGVSWIAVGTVTDASALLLRDSDHIRFVPDGANADAASFDFRAWDQSTGLFGTQVNTSPNGGTTAFSTATDTADIIVNTVNTAPFTTGPVSISTVEDGPTTTYDLYTLFGDTDDPLTSLTFSIVSNDNTVLTTASIDNATGTLTMTQAADLSGVATLTLRATDPSGAFVDTTFTVTVDPVDDPVVNLAPAAQTVADGQFLLFSSANGNSISVSDVDSTNVTVSLSIPAGFLTLGSITGLVFSAGDGISDSQMTFTGSIADVNAALDGLLFQPLVSFGGIVSLEIATWSPDLPPADRAPIRTDVVNVMILDAVVTTESVLPGPVDNQATPAPNDSDDSEPDLEESSTDETEDQIAAEPEYAAGLSGFSDFSVANIELPEVVEPALPDSDFANTREVVSAMTRMLMELGIDGKLPAFIISDAVMDALDAMKDEMGGLDNASDQQHEFLVQLATGLTLTLSAGFVSWMMRAGALLTSLLSTTPLWQRFDPLPVLAGRRDEDEDEDEDRDAVRALFGADA
ncbi:MAG: cadherin-like domain-containing protein, partial [Gammaproteobacteria bacterium]|nr:cadherin-like domain-containing protein [Gammaproteobacteria bacterium]